MHNTKKMMIIVLVVVFSLILSPLLVFNNSNGAVAGAEENILFDMGNGKTMWVSAVYSSGDSIETVLQKTAKANSIDYNPSDTQTIGDPGSVSDFKTTGTTGVTSTAVWSAYSWSGSKWILENDLTATYDSDYLAAAFYPLITNPLNPLDSLFKPNETPNYKSSWTMIRGDAEQDGWQNSGDIATSDATVSWSAVRGGASGVYSSVLSVQGYVFVKFGKSGNLNPAVICYDLNGNQQWIFEYPGLDTYETATPTIMGDYIYVQSGLGWIFKFPWLDGPGVGNANVTTFNNAPMSSVDPNNVGIPYETGANLIGSPYSTGPGSIVYDSGCLYLTSSNGMVYCFDADLNLIWAAQMGGHSYYLSPTVSGGYVFTGALDGVLYVYDKRFGVDETTKAPIASASVYTKTVNANTVNANTYGSVSSPSVLRDGSDYTLMFSVSDGRGMNSTAGGIGIYVFNSDSDTLTKKSLIMDVFGMVSNYLLLVSNDSFKGVYFQASQGLFSVDTNGNYKLLNDTMYPSRAPPVLVNGTSIYLPPYQPGKPIYEVGLDGKIISLYTPSTTVRNYAMSPVLFVDGKIFVGNDAGLIVIKGTFPAYVEPQSSESPWWYVIIWLVIVIVIILAVIYVILRFVKGIEKPFRYLRGRMSHYFGGDDLKHNMKSKHRLLGMILLGILLTVAVFILCLCMGPTATMSVGDMFSSLISAISKGGHGLSYNELMVYESRLPRTLAALAVGIGLSVAGCMYQAIIRNPLVDPYIMGVSAGAGTAAVSVIAFNFTFFGLFAPHSIYLVAFTAMIGGVVAFFATMFIAEKAGGTSMNYVLAGVVIGLAFSAVQTLMLSLSGSHVQNALSWLFGSFANVGWNEIGMIMFPAIALSFVPLIWAKEFNLVLLGEDQAQQMGLNVRRFNRTMLILASLLTAICVAFVGIIGFVGLVIPHLCRMILGGDHRLVLPASIAFGGALMMFADLAARMLMYGQELPVGAITTIIGVPVFAYLLIKRGKMYEG